MGASESMNECNVPVPVVVFGLVTLPNIIPVSICILLHAGCLSVSSSLYAHTATDDPWMLLLVRSNVQGRARQSTEVICCKKAIDQR